MGIYESHFSHLSHSSDNQMPRRGTRPTRLRRHKFFAKEHAAAMLGNVNYITPVPSLAVFDAAAESYVEKLDKISATETARIPHPCTGAE
jgi:hypothetical protein